MPGASDFLNDTYYSQNPQAAFWNRFNLGRNTNQDRYAQGQYGNVYNQFQAQLPNNPNQSFYDFLSGVDLEDQFRNLAPSQRGTKAPPKIRFGPTRRY